MKSNNEGSLCDAVIVLSHHLNNFGMQSRESKLRVDRGIELFDELEAKFLIMNGGPGAMSEGGFFDRESPYVQSDVMAYYAFLQGVPTEQVLKQRFSSDTVGEAYFVRMEHLVPRNLRELVIVTSSYHVPRAAEIYLKVFGHDFNFRFEGIDVPIPKGQLENEKRSLDVFLEQFGNIENGDFRAIERVLYSKHGLYRRERLAVGLRRLYTLHPIDI